MKKILFSTFLILSLVSVEINAKTYITPPYFAYEKCPKDKPFSNSEFSDAYFSNIYCKGCDELKSIKIEKNHEKDFEVCKNRRTFKDRYGSVRSILKFCPNESPFRNVLGDCVSCDFDKMEVYKKEDCSNCPNMDFQQTENGVFCYKKCLKTQISFARYSLCGRFVHNCFDCNTSVTNLEKKECEKCANRIFKNERCEFKNSPFMDKPLIQYEGESDREEGTESAHFYDCETEYAVGSKEECDKCPNREYKEYGCVIKGMEKGKISDPPMSMSLCITY